MDNFDGLLATARAAYARGDWHAAYRQLSQARALSELETADLSLLGRAAWWLGQVKESLEVSEDVYHRFQDDGDASDAAMKALHLGLLWFIRGDVVIASGWVSRARGLLQGLPEGPEHGYLLYLDACLALSLADLGPARETAAKLQDLGRSLRVPALTSFGLVLAGLADLRSGSTASGFAQLDEAMLPVLAGRLPPEWAGEIYCTVIHACHELADLHRMRAWTDATEQWGEQFVGDVVYAGICRIHRLQLQSIEGGWDAAEHAIEQSGAELVGRNNWVAGEAYYQLGEIRRLRGDSSGAEKAYARAWELGTEPQPGESLLQHAAGKNEAAWAGLCAALAGRDRLACARLLVSGVEIALALGHFDEAERLCARLEETAADVRHRRLPRLGRARPGRHADRTVAARRGVARAAGRRPRVPEPARPLRHRQSLRTARPGAPRAGTVQRCRRGFRDRAGDLPRTRCPAGCPQARRRPHFPAG